MKYLENKLEKSIGTLILSHGAGAPMDSTFMNELVGELNRQGVSVIRFEFPYMLQRREDGKKRPPNRAPVLLEYFDKVIEEVATRDDIVKPLLIGGKSMGGRVASMLSEHAKVDGVCCFGYPFIPPGKPQKLAERTAHLLTAQKPILIFQGTRDPFGKPGEISSVKFSNTVKIEWLDDGDHDFKPRKSSGLTQHQLIKLVAVKVAGHIQSIH